MRMRSAQCKMEIEKRDSVAFIRIKKAYNQNKLTAVTMQQLMQALDEVESFTDVTCLVTTGEGKFYSSGLDVSTESLLKHDAHQIAADMGLLHTLLARLLTFPIPTIATISGHAFGAGAFLALAHDYRIMRSDRGWWCVPAATVGLQIPLPQGLIALLRTKVPPPVLGQVVLARRFSGEEAAVAGIVHEVCPLGDLTDRAIAVAGKLTSGGGLDRRTLSTLKHDLYKDAYTALSNGISYAHSKL